MPGDIRNTASGFHILRVGLLVALLLGASGCDLIDVLGIPGRSGGSIWLIVPLGLGGNVGILNPTGGQTASNQTANDGDSTTAPIPASVLSGPEAASSSLGTTDQPTSSDAGATTGAG